MSILTSNPSDGGDKNHLLNSVVKTRIQFMLDSSHSLHGGVLSILASGVS